MKVLLTLLIALTTASLFGDFRNIRPSYSGAWYNVEQSGHGISVEALDEERTVFFWYTYDNAGKPFWLLAVGENSEISITGLMIPHIRVEATAYYYEGMVFGEFIPATNTRQEWGTIVLEFPYSECNLAHMEWFPTMDGFTQGATDLERLTTLYGLDCVDPQDPTGNWDVQFGFDAEFKYQTEVLTVPNPDHPDMSDLIFEFEDETGCLWSGEIFSGFGLITADWSNQCGTTTVEHSGFGTSLYEYELCEANNDCAWKNEVMIFDDEGEYLIFSR